jgi:hypothetical protein
MKALLILLIALLAAAILSGASHARVSSKLYCWVPDVEFPVGCNDDDDDDD